MNKKTDEIMARLEAGKLPGKASDWLHLMRMLAARVWEDIRWHCWGKWSLRRLLLKHGTDKLKQALRDDGYHEWKDGLRTVFWKEDHRVEFTKDEATPNDPKLSDGGAWRGSCVVERGKGIRAREKGGSDETGPSQK